MELSLGMKIWNQDDVDVKPVPLFRTRPTYPSKAKAKNITGRVTFKLLVDKDGMVKTIEIIDAEPQGVFEEATVNAVRQWRFQPAKVKGKPVPCWCQSSIAYDLDLD
jgi:protein TonB